MSSPIRAIFSIILLLCFFSSCTLLQKTGIEKRRYRPGFYLPTTLTLSKFSKHPKPAIASKEKHAAAIILPEPDNNESGIQQALNRLNPKKVIAPLPSIPFKDVTATKVAQVSITNNESEENVKSTNGLFHSDESSAGILIVLGFIASFLLLIWAISAIFPTMNYVIAILIGLGIAILLWAIILFILA